MIDRHLIRYFLAVVDQGNFTRAAKHSRVSQPTLSAGIAKLEGVLGRTLFERSNRRVELTSAGARFSPYARKIEADFVEATRAVLVERPVQTVRVGLLSSLPATWCQKIAFAAANATERVEIVDARARDLHALLDRGRIDVAVGVPTLTNHSDPVEIFLTEPYLLAMGLTHPLAMNDVIDPEQLALETMLVRRDCEVLSDVSRYFTSYGIRPFMAVRTVSEERAVSYIRAGLGITVMPRCFTAEGLSMVRLNGFLLTRSIGLFSRTRQSNPVMLSNVIVEIREALMNLAAEHSNMPD